MANSPLMIKGQHAHCSMPRWIVPRNCFKSLVRDAITVAYVLIKEAS
jgi:hypothetical protein